MYETAAAEADQHDRGFLRVFSLQESGGGFHGVESLDGDAQGDESEAGARPGEEGALVGEVVSGYAAGGGDGEWSEEFEPVGHGGVGFGPFQVITEHVSLNRESVDLCPIATGRLHNCMLHSLWTWRTPGLHKGCIQRLHPYDLLHLGNHEFVIELQE